MSKRSEAKKLSDQFNNIRRRLRTRADQMEKFADTLSGDLRREYRARARSIRTQANKLYIDKVTKRKPGTAGYTKRLEQVLQKAKEYESYFPNYRTTGVAKRMERTSWNNLLKAGKEIFVYTYRTVWQSGMTQEQIGQAIRNEVTKRTGIRNPTINQTIQYYENAIKQTMISEVKRKIDTGSMSTVEGERVIERITNEYTLSYDDVTFEDMMSNVFDQPVYTENGSPITYNIESKYTKYLGL